MYVEPDFQSTGFQVASTSQTKLPENESLYYSSTNVFENGDLELEAPSISHSLANGKQKSSLYDGGSMDDIMEVSTSSVPRDTRKTGYVYDTRMMAHYATIGEHPEKPERISEIFQIFVENHLIPEMEKLPLRDVEKNEVLLVHSRDHWDKVETIQFMTEEEIIESEQFYELLSLYVSPATTLAAKLSCGGVIESSLAVANGRVRNAFAIVRPPGHHAEPDEHMGFCFYNNVAVAARVVQQRTNLKRILILDWDVHHGNGTQRAFYDDPSVLYISIHRFDNGQFYPCGPFGGMSACGEGAGLGKSVNIPWPEKGMGDADYLFAFQKLVMPIAYEFAPELVIISAGFDAADGDTLGECHVTPGGFAHMTYMLSSLAGGKLVVALEGGYDVDAVAKSSLEVAKVLLGDPPPELGPMIASDVATEVVWQCAYMQSRYWKSIDPKSCEPREELGDVVVTIPDLLKAHRAHFLAKEYQMLEIPLVDETLQDNLGSQILCSQDIFDNETLLLVAHDFGNLRVQLQNRAECDVELEHGYLIDATRHILRWCREQEMAIIDLNLHPRSFTQKIDRQDDGPLTQPIDVAALLYIWDNYIELSDAKTVAIVALGNACKAVISLLSERITRQRVKAVVHIVGHSAIPTTPKATTDDMKTWYRRASLTVIPRNHKQVPDDSDIPKRYGNIEISQEESAVKAFLHHAPLIETFIRARTSDRDR